MKHYIIDGNNLIGRAKYLSLIQKKDKQAVREKLAYILERYFYGKTLNVSLHFDGFAANPINSANIRIYYSEKKSADEMIKYQIEQFPNRRNIVLVTSDKNLIDFGKACHCSVIASEKFSESIKGQTDEDEEKRRIDELNNTDEFRRLFGE